MWSMFGSVVVRNTIRKVAAIAYLCGENNVKSRSIKIINGGILSILWQSFVVCWEKRNNKHPMDISQNLVGIKK